VNTVRAPTDPNFAEPTRSLITVRADRWDLPASALGRPRYIDRHDASRQP